MLQSYIRSYIPGLWDDTPVPKEWISWYNTLKDIPTTFCVKDKSFEANNIDEFYKILSNVLIYLDYFDYLQTHELEIKKKKFSTWKIIQQ